MLAWPTIWLPAVLLLPLLCLLLALAPDAQAQQRRFSFGVIGQPGRIGPSEEPLRQALAETDRQRLAFVVLTGLKSASEPCSDRLYSERREMLAEARSDIIVSLSASDWAECRREDGGSAAMNRLEHVREIFFTGPTSIGGARLPVARQSASAQFRRFSENMRWEAGGILFGTVNVPGDNNHYKAEAGRNSEFEDRTIANRAWLRRLAQTASREKKRALVLFFDGDPRLAAPLRGARPAAGGRDGYQEFRRQLRELTAQFPGRVLLVHQPREAGAATGMVWRGNLGELMVGPGWIRVMFDARTATFSIAKGS